MAPALLLADANGTGVANQTFSEELNAQNRTSETILQAATRVLASMEAIGVTERLHESLVKISRVLGCQAPSSVEHKNSAPQRLSAAEVDRETLSVIERLTAVDSQLYAAVLNQS